MYIPPYTHTPGDRIWYILTPVLAFGGIIVVSTIAHLITLWHIAHSPHATATIRRIQQGAYIDRYDVKHIYPVGELTFVRIQDGKTYNCDEAVNLGFYPTKYKVGQELDVVPRYDSCWGPLIVDASDGWF